MRRTTRCPSESGRSQDRLQYSGQRVVANIEVSQCGELVPHTDESDIFLTDLDCAVLGQEDVLRLQVSMKNLARVEVRKALARLDKHVPYVGLGDPIGGVGVPGDQLGEVAPRRELGDDVERPGLGSKQSRSKEGKRMAKLKLKWQTD